MDYKRALLLYFTNGMSSRGIAEVTGGGKATVNEFLKRFRECKELSYAGALPQTPRFSALRFP